MALPHPIRDSRPLPALILFYLAIVLLQASLKLIWADELITLYIARQQGIAGIWAALRAGADPNPPLMHVLVQASTALFGPGALALRLPAILCVLLALLAMGWMLRRWVTPVFALAGVLAFMATRGFDYAYDARSYAPMMGFSMASLALWIFAADLTGRRRLVALTAMAFALAAGISSNYYCVLAFFPIAIGELVASKQSRRLRLDLWLALALAALPLIAYLPLIRHNLAEFGPHAWNRPHPDMILFSYIELVEGIFWPVLALTLYALWNLKRLRDPERSPTRAASTPTRLSSALKETRHPERSPARTPRQTQPKDPHDAHPASTPSNLARESEYFAHSRAPFIARLPHAMSGTSVIQRPPSPPELAALLTLLLYPFLGFALALAGHAMISPRCVAPVCCGFGLAAGILAQRIFANHRRAGPAIVLLLLVWVTVREAFCASLLLQQRRAFHSLQAQITRLADGPILIADSAFVLPLYFYSQPELRRRIVFPIDFEAIHRYENDDSGEQNLWAGRNDVFPFRIRTMDQLALDPRGPLLLIARPDGWLAHSMQQCGFRLAPVADLQDWSNLGGVSTPISHPETRLMQPVENLSNQISR